MPLECSKKLFFGPVVSSEGMENGAAGGAVVPFSVISDYFATRNRGGFLASHSSRQEQNNSVRAATEGRQPTRPAGLVGNRRGGELGAGLKKLSRRRFKWNHTQQKRLCPTQFTSRLFAEFLRKKKRERCEYGLNPGRHVAAKGQD